MFNKRSLVVAALTVLALLPASAPAEASTASRMVAKMNAVRAAHGIGPLREVHKLNRSSYRWGRYLMRRDWLGHASLSKSHVKGEIIELHGGRANKIARTVGAWMSSSGHRAVLLAGRFHRVGVGKTTGRFNGRRVTIWVARFK
jgi:uncharacterized protein YkwD